MSVKVKICGIRSIEAAKEALEAGADFLGFNFVSNSKRYIDPDKVKKIIELIAASDIKTVGVFQDISVNKVREIAEYLGLDIVQLHGQIDPDYCRKIKSTLVIKALNIPADFNVEEVEEQMRGYDADYYLVDREIQGQGECLNPDKVKQLGNKFPIFLSGGLNPENVAFMVQRAKPKAVDVSSGVETDGQKDPEKIKAFIINTKEAI